MDISQFSGLVQFCLISLLFAKTLREKWPKTGFFLVRILLYLVRIQKNADQKKLLLSTLFTQWRFYSGFYKIKIWKNIKQNEGKKNKFHNRIKNKKDSMEVNVTEVFLKKKKKRIWNKSLQKSFEDKVFKKRKKKENLEKSF